jgi:hypothetical protein
MDWEKWRLTFRGGPEFRERYLRKFDLREDDTEFQERKDLTPVPSFAKAAINEIRNAIFQRLGDVVRRGGSDAYQKAVAGESGGVDLRGASMNFFLGDKILTDLLVMGKCGVYVDMPEIKEAATLADVGNVRPYLYSYAVEDILNFNSSKPEDPSEFKSILLRDTILNYDMQTLLPLDYTQRYRLVYINQHTGFVNIQFMDPDGNKITRDGEPGGGPVEIKITRIPFVMLDIGDSLLKDVAEYQIALLNILSADVSYAIRSNFPWLAIQRDPRAAGGHLKSAATDGSAQTGGQGAQTEVTRVGPSYGKYYDKDTLPPQYVAPPSEPLQTSMALRKEMEADIRKLVNLAVQGLAGRASAESKSMDNQGLDAGLSFIGLILEGAERRIADFWASYQEKEPSKRKIASIKYPDRYSLKTDADRIEEASKLADLIAAVPSRTARKEISKNFTHVLLQGKIKVDILDKISGEIDAAPYTTSDPDTIIAAREAGIVGDQTASMALGFEDDEYLQAQKDHIKRAEAIAKAQGIGKEAGGDPGARGVKDLSADPQAAAKEKEASRNTDLKVSTKKPVRGEGK